MLSNDSSAVVRTVCVLHNVDNVELRLSNLETEAETHSRALG